MRQRGNILFLILLAVVLFAALSYAVTRNERGQVKDVSKERAETIASQLIQNAGLIENTIMRGMTVGGIPDYGFDLSGTYTTSAPNNTCTSTACRVFSDKGGPVPSMVLPAWASEFGTDINMQFYMVTIVNVGTDLPDLVMMYRGAKQEVCDAYNRLSSASELDGVSKLESWGWLSNNSGLAWYTGTLTAMPSGYSTLGDSYAALKGKRSFCFYHNGAPSEGHVLIYVLMAR